MAALEGTVGIDVDTIIDMGREEFLDHISEAALGRTDAENVEYTVSSWGPGNWLTLAVTGDEPESDDYAARS